MKWKLSSVVELRSWGLRETGGIELNMTSNVGATPLFTWEMHRAALLLQQTLLWEGARLCSFGK